MIRSCIVHETELRIALLAHPLHHTFPAPPTHLFVRIEASSHSLRRLNNCLARHHPIRIQNFIVLWRFNCEGIQRGHSEFLSR